MKRPRFGRDDAAPTREELEREAARELERMTRQGGGPPPSGGPSGWSSAPPPPTSPPSSFQPRFGGGTPAAPAQPSVRERFESRDQEEEEDDGEDYSEEEMVTELALRDWSERSGRGRSIEDLALPRIDPASVEAQRDRALREFTERQARMERESEAARIQRQAMGLTPPSRAGTVNLTAARPMGMLNLSAQAAGMRNQGAAVSTVPEPTSKTFRKPAVAKAKPSTSKASPTPAPAKAAKAAGKTAASKPAKSGAKSVAPPVTKPAKPVGKAPKAVAKAPKSVGKAPKSVGKPPKAVGKPPKAVGKPPRPAGKATTAANPPPATKAAVGKAKKAPVARVTPAKKKAPAKAPPSPRKGSGRR